MIDRLIYQSKSDSLLLSVVNRGGRWMGDRKEEDGDSFLSSSHYYCTLFDCEISLIYASVTLEILKLLLPADAKPPSKLGVQKLSPRTFMECLASRFHISLHNSARERIIHVYLMTLKSS